MYVYMFISYILVLDFAHLSLIGSAHLGPLIPFYTKGPLSPKRQNTNFTSFFILIVC